MQHKVQLTEAFDNPFQWRWVTRGAEAWDAVFTTPVGIYDVHLAASEFGNATWSIAFGPANRDAEAGDEKFGIHNLGNQTVASRILATVIAVIKDFAKAHGSVQQFFFQSVEPSRTKLYLRMTQRFLGPGPTSMWPGWEAELTPGRFATSFMIKKSTGSTVAAPDAPTKGMGSETGPTQ